MVQCVHWLGGLGPENGERHENAGPENDVLFNEYAGFKVIYVYVRFMGVPLQFVNKHVFTVILLKVHWADRDLFTRANHIVFLYECLWTICVCSVTVLINKTHLLYNLTLITLVLHFPVHVSVVLHFQVLHFQSTRRQKRGEGGRGLPNVPPLLHLPLHHCLKSTFRQNFALFNIL